MNSLSKDILSVLYTRTWFNPAELKLGYKETYEIMPDGKVIYRHYQGTSRKIAEKVEWTIEGEQARLLFDEIIDCMHNADQVIGYVDDCGAQVKLTFWDGIIELPRGFGTMGTDIGTIMEKFTSSLGNTKTDEK